jgi:hypothetical protein
MDEQRNMQIQPKTTIMQKTYPKVPNCDESSQGGKGDGQTDRTGQTKEINQSIKK